jgi:hypothetical protein
VSRRGRGGAEAPRRPKRRVWCRSALRRPRGRTATAARPAAAARRPGGSHSSSRIVNTVMSTHRRRAPAPGPAATARRTPPGAAGCAARAVRRPASAMTSGSALPVMALCCMATRIDGSTSASTFSSRERDSDWISSSSWLRCSDASATRASSSASLAAASRAFLGLLGQHLRLGGLGAAVLLALDQLLFQRLDALLGVPGQHQGRGAQRGQQHRTGGDPATRQHVRLARRGRRRGRIRRGRADTDGRWGDRLGHGAADCIGRPSRATAASASALTGARRTWPKPRRCSARRCADAAPPRCWPTSRPRATAAAGGPRPASC